MYEHHQQPPISRKRFLLRLMSSTSIILIVIMISLGVGVLGYHFLDQMTWVDALLNAAMILGGMGSIGQLNTDAGKIFASIFALYSGLVLIGATAILLTPVVHRVLHKFHYTKPTKEN